MVKVKIAKFAFTICICKICMESFIHLSLECKHTLHWLITEKLCSSFIVYNLPATACALKVTHP